MHYYQFNIGDYASHTAHLDPIEDVSYRRMIDWCYLHEKPLPESLEEISRLIRMRTHCDSIANVLREFFILGDEGYTCSRVCKELEKYKDKSDKARESAKARWDKKPSKNKGAKAKKNGDANALRTECEGNANHKPLTNNHKPLTKAVTLPFWSDNPAWEQLANKLGKPSRPGETTDQFKNRIKNLVNGNSP